ncbi:hypothetical protein BD769DRAFT_1664505 [Suillus cothurnatus]|nr:hypothetical protein BD769DRAFT_1664505 [Suillus cothurnatus]
MPKCTAPNEDEWNTKHVRLEAPLPLNDPAAWDILEWYLMTDQTYGQIEDDFHMYLSDGDDQLSLSNLLALKHKHILEQQSPDVRSPTCQQSCTVKNLFINLEAQQDEDKEDENDEDIEVVDGQPKPPKLTVLPACKHNLTYAIERIKENIHSSSSNLGGRTSPVTIHDTPVSFLQGCMCAL